MTRRKLSHTVKHHAASPTLRQLSQFRYQLRLFLRFSEKAARAAGITPQQHQLLLGVAAFTGRGWATISELAEFLQERHNAVVTLVSRASRANLVRKEGVARDRRLIRVDLTPACRAVLTELTGLHRKELARFEWGRLPLGLKKS
ncbi:MAG: MarR family winged helix-turn-helix transcriptional regulator [Bryobacteraceae bacterium]